MPPADVEMFVVQLNGGPLDGSRLAVDSNQQPWPLPGIFPADGGRYIKVSESQAPPAAVNDHYMRGALYEWQPDQEGQQSAEAQSGR